MNFINIYMRYFLTLSSYEVFNTVFKYNELELIGSI